MEERNQTKSTAADSSHEVPLSTQAANAMPSSNKTSHGEDGPEESNNECNEVDDAEDENDHVSLVMTVKSLFQRRITTLLL